MATESTITADDGRALLSGFPVIASFTLAVAAGASPIEAAIFSNHAAGVVVGKVGTATVSPAELAENFRRE